MNLDSLKQQLASLEAEKEAGKAQFYRAEGAIALAQHLIAQLESEAKADAPKEG